MESYAMKTDQGLWHSTKGLRSALTIFLLYLICSQLAHTLLYTVVAYLVSITDKTGTEFGNTVNEIAGQYHFVAFAIGAMLFSITLWKGDRALYKSNIFWNDAHKPFWQLNRFTKEELLRGIASGFMASVVYLFLFSLSKQGSFLGLYLTSTFGTPVFPLFFLDFFALATLLFCEEYIFRHKILAQLKPLLGTTASILLTSVFYLLIKFVQFELTTVDYGNLFLMNLAASCFYLKSTKAHRGLGFLIALLCSLHCLAGLPLWDNESPSFFLFKSSSREAEILFGGGGGPFNGLALSCIFLVFTFGIFFSWKSEKEARQKSKMNSTL
jgi:hypothetical protein